MTEPKLDVETLAYIRDSLMIEVGYYEDESKLCAKQGDYYDADRYDAKRSALQHFKRMVERLIKDQEA